ncbi:MAG: chemotaxis protein CheD, partial [Thermoplasmata archaeon]
MYEKNFTFENNKKVINVGVGEYVISKDEILTIIGLGSCIAIALYEERKFIGGLGHARLPKYNDGKDKIHVGKYADTLVYLLVDGLVERGASKSSIKAK